MPLNWAGKKGLSPAQAGKKAKANKPAKKTLGMKAAPGNQGSKLADSALAKSKASRKKANLPKPQRGR